LSRVGSPRELSFRIRKILSSSPTSQLDRLVTVPDCTLALAAGWERVCRTLPEEERDEAIGLNEQAVSRFLGLLEGRIQFPIPEPWEASVKAAKGYSQRHINFARPKPADQSVIREGHLRRVGSQWMVKQESQLIKLPAEDGFGPIDYAAAERAGGTVYVALYGSPPYPYKLFAVDRATGRVLWSSKVWAISDWRGYSGQESHDVFLRSAGETVAVFGISGPAVYVDGFDQKTGENRFRFSTAYFDRSSPRE
jgi:hypothetical protein